MRYAKTIPYFHKNHACPLYHNVYNAINKQQQQQYIF